MSTDKKLVSSTRIVRIKEDGVPPANQLTSKKLLHHNETNMVSARKLAEMQKLKEAAAAKAAAAAKVAEAVEDMTDVTEETKTNSQEEAVGTKRKHNDESSTVNAQSEKLTTATHMGAVGTQIPIMGSIVNEQQPSTNNC